MWRSLFLAIGCFAMIAGVQCLLIDKAILTDQAASPSGPFGGTVMRSRELVPPEWAPWSLLSAGAVIVLYSFTIPQRVKE